MKWDADNKYYRYNARNISDKILDIGDIMMIVSIVPMIHIEVMDLSEMINIWVIKL